MKMSIDRKVLVVTDNRGWLNLLAGRAPEGFRGIKATDGEEGQRLAEIERPDVILVWDSLPDMTCLEFIESLKGRSTAPIMVIGEKGDKNELLYLTGGADDFVAYPFNENILWARVKLSAQGKIHTDIHSSLEPILAGDIEVDLVKRLVRKKGVIVSLTRTEWKLLEDLASHVGSIRTNTELLTNVWGPDYRDDLQYLRVWISRLRNKLEDEPSKPILLITHAGIGYSLDDQDEMAKAIPHNRGHPHVDVDIHTVHTPAESILRT
jgi:two-component system, OmpR family, KDP operon response regulator KdpE